MINRRFVVALGLVLVAYIVSHAGNFEPPGPPFPTTKSLSDVEPRTPIRGADMPLVVSTPGAYYFAESIVSQNGITITASDVSIDMLGFTFSAAPGASTAAIQADSGLSNIVIRNGSITGFPAGILLDQAFGARVEKVLVHGIGEDGNGDDGIRVGQNSIVLDSQSIRFDGDGIETGSNSIVRNSIARWNEASGIRAGTGTVVEHSIAANNGDGDGIIVGPGSTVLASTSWGNERGCGICAGAGSTVVDNSVQRNCVGIAADHGSAVRGNTVTDSQCTGIRVDSGTAITDNTVDNGTLGGPGIRATGSFNVLDGNKLSHCALEVTGTENLVIRNFTSLVVISVGGGNKVAPFQDAAAATNPFANIDHD